jgi:hypothetical protein
VRPTPLSQALTEEYKGYVAKETSDHDWRYAHDFARKGLHRRPRTRMSSRSSRRPGMCRTRRSRSSSPPAQARFDCWVQKADEDNVPHRTTYLNYDPSGDYPVSEPDISNPDEYQAVPCKSAFKAAIAFIRKP